MLVRAWESVESESTHRKGTGKKNNEDMELEGLKCVLSELDLDLELGLGL